ncbi:uncharacterized protein GGS22DRAFT_97640 [Annulohypoxylon maeteangense]|uniref:uncharacterized protein n=1 Tax=Annulohypoxylon maeteangense TaxID=1927788 RepID=UPI00200770DA|nr:uncharacterized protein GGS22DRAFT_97640 [Annulohypoxylon maeteangense]KAI0888464.1 hypothetical protein GGS22DRAFT_97640 [Annulohypoxylon maeteangense]
MQLVLYRKHSSLQFVLLLFFSTFTPFCSASVIQDLHSNYYDPPPSPEDGPPLSAGALRDTTYLPAQIGGIVGSYALSLVVVAALLLILAKKRREHLTAGEEDLEGQYPYSFAFPPPQLADAQNTQYGLDPPKSPIKNFSYPTPPTPLTDTGPTSPYIVPSLHSTSTLGVNPLVDPRVVAADREMAQQQLEEMYRLVMEQEAAKEAGVTLDQPPAPLSSQQQAPKQGILKRGKNKPANLDLQAGAEKPQSRTSSILSAFKSPRKKNVKGISISSPIMTPMSGTFPRHEEEEMSSIPPRHYAPASPPPIPTDQIPYARASRQHIVAPITPPDISPESTQSIDERLGHMRNNSQYTDPDPVSAISAISDRSTAPLVGLPSSPKPGVNRFPSLPASPKPGATFPTSPRLEQSFSRPNAPSAVRTGGALPLRAYEPALSSPSAQTTKQTTFERAMPLSPSGLRTPWTGAPVPYTPYQPFSPVVPITPSLVTKADRKRMKQLQPKTPTVEMVKSSDEMW